MTKVSKELITALRGVRRKYGASAFDQAIKGLANGEVKLIPGKRSRPGLDYKSRMVFAWAHVKAYSEVHGCSVQEAAKKIKPSKLQLVTGIDTPGGLFVTRKPIAYNRSKSEILRLYEEAEQLRQIDKNFADQLDVRLEILRPFIKK